MNDEPEAPPTVLELPVGLDAPGERIEVDSLGAVAVPADRYWGAQTQRSLRYFAIGADRMPLEVVHAYGRIKQAAAIVNGRAGRLPAWMGELIARVAEEVADGRLDDHFPLHVWQTGSGTHTNMNVNEVIANRCIQLVGGQPGARSPIHPNDDVNMAQSSNDTFPTAMHLAGYATTTERTMPALRALRDAIDAKAQAWDQVVKVGRTHLQDATPLTVGQEWSGWVGALDDALDDLARATDGLLHVAMGGTAVGTGLNAPEYFGAEVATVLSELTGHAVVPAANPFTAQATLDRMVRAHGALKATAVTLFKIANDLRWLGSGPRAGLMELHLPANEPGSSIMPGKVNPSQAEATLMVCIQVMGTDVAVQMAGAEGNLQLNAFRPVVIAGYLASARLLADASEHLRRYMIEGTRLNDDQLRTNVERSVMLVTALAPVIGYDRAAEIAHHAVDHDLTLRHAARDLGVDAALFDDVVIPLDLTRPGTSHR